MNPKLLSRRFPGVTPFEREQEHLFFGRDREIADLLRLTSLEKLLVLFGKSGHGKSSLLNAGLLPKLETAFRGKRCIPLSIRLGAYAKDQSLSPKEALLSELERAVAPAPDTGFYENLPVGRSLWREFKRRQAHAGQPTAFVLLFDQFEEFFLYPPDQQQQFRQEISELLYTEIPQPVFHEFDRLDDAAQDHLSAPPDVHVVFAIRSDRLHQLDSMKQELPAILHKRYELRGLSPEQAEAAMVQPAAAAGAQFLTQPFVFQPKALQSVIANLARGAEGDNAGQIESFQLQIVCQSIEDDVLARNRRGEKQVQIAAADLPDFEQVFENYYAARIGSLNDPEMERSARLLLEEELLYVDEAKGEARRLSMDGDALAANLQTKHGRTLPPTLLDALVNSFIVRREKTARGAHYEISHDTLVGAVLKSREARRQTEKAAAEQARLLAEAEKQRLERIKITRARNRNLAVGLGALLLLVWALWQTVQAGKLQRRAETASASVVKSLLKDARTDVLHLQYEAAFEKLRNAAEVGQLRDSVGLALLEPAFFYAESGQFPKANSVLAIAAPLLGTPKPALANNQAAAQKALRALSDKRYLALQARYYPVMLDIPAGRFMMGDDTLSDDSQPIHEVQLAAFKLAETETTFWQWGLYCAATGQAVSDFSPDWGIDGDNPVVNQSWYQAVDYANWLSRQWGLKEAYDLTNWKGEGDELSFDVALVTGAKGFRLPTEAEWEYAARGNEPYLYAGSDRLDEVGWYYENSPIKSVQRTHPVGRKKRNGFGLYDMSGNVWEWCEENWHDNYEGAPADGAAWVDSPEGFFRVHRGGSWLGTAGNCRIAFRGSTAPAFRYRYIGFRLAL